MTYARPRTRLLPLLLVLFLLWRLLSHARRGPPVQHRIVPGRPLPPLDFLAQTDDAGERARRHAEHYASDAARDFCAAHGYPVFVPSSPKPAAGTRKRARPGGERKIYDLIMVNTELDLLEIRLHALRLHVDYFVVVESPRTFQGGAKPLVLRDNWARFAPYHDRIIYHELVFPEGFRPRRAWDYEDLQRDAPYEQVLVRLAEEEEEDDDDDDDEDEAEDGDKRDGRRRAPSPGDVLLVADVDEIPRPETLLLLRTCAFPRRLTLSSRFYYYSFQFLHAGPEWPHPQATFYEGPRRTLRPTNLRNGDGGFRPLRGLESGVLANAAWHCSSCFATVAQFLDKMASFSHGWMNAAPFRDRDRIAAAVRDGRDVWGRERDTFRRVDPDGDVPPLVREEPERFAYMLRREGESAGFADYP